MELVQHIGLTEIGRYRVEESSAESLQQLLRDKWAGLRQDGHAADQPIELMRSASSADGAIEFVEVFRWKSEQDRDYAQTSPAVRGFREALGPLGVEPLTAEYAKVVRGFNRDFPSVGGMELLRGVCSCLLDVDGYVSQFPMSVKNGVVLMHRSPGEDFDGDGRREMHLKIMYHGGEIVIGDLGAVRVEQNFDLPNDGIVKSRGIGGHDFPATAIWRVHWRIRTPLGYVMTDPATPLVFGPSAVGHYPPVGTEFHSTTGPVGLFLEDGMLRIGTLTPGELTAFDIITTKDDEISSDYLNPPAPDLIEALASRISAS
jgi:hypothetical protein